MSSARSRGMGLRGLVLGGAVAVSSFSLSGCWAAGAAWILQEDANSKRAAEAQKESARTIADAVRGHKNVDGGEVRRDDGAPSIEYFTCTDLIDLDKNGGIDTEREVIDKGKTEFYIGDSCCYVGKFTNLKGRTLKFYAQYVAGGEIRLIKESIIPNNALIRTFGRVNLVDPAYLHAYVTMDDVKVADFRVNFKEDPTKTITKK